MTTKTKKIEAEIDDAIARRFWQKVDARGEGECWPWLGAKATNGRGVAFGWGRGTTAPRLAYVLAHGLRLDDLTLSEMIVHKCGSVDCVNPTHLEKISRSEWRRRAADNLAGDFPIDPDEKLPGSKFSANDIRRIRREGGDRKAKYRLMSEFGVSRQTIDSILKRETWWRVE